MKKYIKLSVILILLMTFLCSCNIYTDIYPNAESYSVGSAEFSDEIKSIDISWFSGEVNIVHSNTDTIKISEETKKDIPEELEMHYWANDGVLYIKFAVSGRIKPYIALNKVLTVAIPESFTFDNVNISSASGDISAEAFCANEVELDSASGKIDAEISNAKRIILGSASGNVKLKQNGSCDKLEIDSASGKINVEAESIASSHIDSASGDISLKFKSDPKECDIDSASGKVSLYLPDNSSFTADIDTSSGDFDCDFPLIKKGNTFICGNGDADIRIDTSSGNISILKK